MNNKLVSELRLIALLAILLPTAVLLTLSPLWWYVDSIKVFAGYLLGIIGTAALLGAVSIHDEVQVMKKGRKNDGR